MVEGTIVYAESCEVTLFYVVDDCSDSSHPVVPGFGDVVHDGGIHPCSLGHCDRRGAASRDSWGESHLIFYAIYYLWCWHIDGVVRDCVPGLWCERLVWCNDHDVHCRYGNTASVVYQLSGS